MANSTTTSSMDRVPIYSIVPAAGIGSRMRSSSCAESDLSKQYMSVAGKTVIEHALSPLVESDEITRVVVPISQHDEVWPTLAIASHVKVFPTIGGATRVQSVFNGLLALAETIEDTNIDGSWVIVHDAARPCLESKKLAALIAQVRKSSLGGILAIPAQDTLKSIRHKETVNKATSEALYVAETLDRSTIWMAQTPQMFRFGELKMAIHQSLNTGAQITDESAAMELAGYPVQLVKGSSANLKITTPADLLIAESYFQTGR